MKRNVLPVSLAFLVFGLFLSTEVRSQGVTIQVGDEVVVIPKEMAQKVKETALKVSTGVGRKTVRQKSESGRDALSRNDVERLARRFRLIDEASMRTNPHLAFGGEELSYWQRQNLTEPELELQFVARRIILDAAERKKVRIRDQEMLSQAARRFIASISEGDDKPAKSAARIKQEPPPDVPGLICEGDTSETLIKQAWEGLNAGKGGMGVKEFEKALACTKVVIDTWAGQADEQQAERLQAGTCKLTPKPQDKDSYSGSYWALSDVAAAWFIRGQIFSQQKKWPEARDAYRVVTDKYHCAFTWDPRGWFWRTAEGAERELKKLP